jgi:hypothetical protein
VTLGTLRFQPCLFFFEGCPDFKNSLTFVALIISTSRKANHCPNDRRKQGCGRMPAPLFSGFFKLFRDLLIIIEWHK